ncbi:hypothetical protein LU276_02165 [Moraxella haemolytica]|uniref:hypothetical protein n=1 Tax=Moraxella TaxID=475 RepID=UPI0025427EDC|nr:hypothetical protein [Moraxella sp. ZY171148]WII95662.1 hypothetical protein LU276_02165 [Moraxella sp. ZY171148]
MMVGSAYLLKIVNQSLGKQRTVAFSILLVAVGIVLSVVDNFYGFCIALAMMGVGVVMFNISSMHIRCTATPKHVRTSFEFVFLACCIAFIPVGVVLTTWALRHDVLIYFYGTVGFIMLILSWVVIKNTTIAHIYQIGDERLDGHYGTLYPKLYS